MTPAAPRLLRPFPVVRIKGVLTADGAQITLLSVRAPRGVTIAVRCRGRGCPRKAFTAPPGARRLRLFERALPAGTRLSCGSQGEASSASTRRSSSGAAPSPLDRTGACAREARSRSDARPADTRSGARRRRSRRARPGVRAAFALASRPDAVQRARVAPSSPAQPPRLIVPLRAEPASDVTERRERVSVAPWHCASAVHVLARARVSASPRPGEPPPVAPAAGRRGPRRSAAALWPVGSTAPAGFGSTAPAPPGRWRRRAVRLPAPSTSGSSGSAAPAPPGSPGGGAPSTSGSPRDGASPTRPASGFDLSGTFESER